VLDNLSSDLLLTHFYHGLAYLNSCQISCQFVETTAHLITTLSTNVECIETIGFCKLIMLLSFYCLHMIKINLVSHKSYYWHFFPSEAFANKAKPVFQILETLLVCDIIHENALLEVNRGRLITAFAS
jgi:hypothetical protein